MTYEAAMTPVDAYEELIRKYQLVECAIAELQDDDKSDAKARRKALVLLESWDLEFQSLTDELYAIHGHRWINTRSTLQDTPRIDEECQTLDTKDGSEILLSSPPISQNGSPGKQKLSEFPSFLPKVS